MTNKNITDLFKSADDWHNNACLNLKHTNSYYTYALGYKEAADFLALHATGLNHQDLLIYPIAFLYRHHFELQLKLIIYNTSLLFDKSDCYPKGHKLDILWAEFKNYIPKLWPDSPLSNFESIDTVINAYTEIDRESQTFRYPIDQKGNNLLADISHINIRHLAV